MNRVENWATFKCGFWGLFGHDPNESFQKFGSIQSSPFGNIYGQNDVYTTILPRFVIVFSTRQGVTIGGRKHTPATSVGCHGGNNVDDPLSLGSIYSSVPTPPLSLSLFVDPALLPSPTPVVIPTLSHLLTQLVVSSTHPHFIIIPALSSSLSQVPQPPSPLSVLAQVLMYEYQESPHCVTGTKNHVLYYAYIEMCRQLDPQGLFNNLLRETRCDPVWTQANTCYFCGLIS
uniref:Uncharacterized protein n=1 Tax=Oryza rufipogon TaxID=4529 RepID=A0A0E0N142_ORYRU